VARLEEAADGAPLTIEIARSGDPTIVLSGELDYSNADRVRAALDEVLETPPKRLLFELSGLRFMDSSGLALLLMTAAKVEAVTVVRPSTNVRRLLETTGLTDALHVET
jgi:anti-sigma B factor antagonist